MSGSASGGFSENEFQFDQRIFGQQANALNKLYGQLGGLFNRTNDQMQQRIPGATQQNQEIYDQSSPAWQQQLKGGAYSGLDMGNNLMRSLNKSENTPSNMQQINSMIMGGDGNNYADAMKEQYVKDANRAQENMLSNLDARAAGSGMSGSSRQGVAQGIGMRGINDQLQRQMAKTGYDTFDKDLNRKLGIAQQADQSTLARQGMMQNMLSQDQQARMGGLNMGQGRQSLNMGQFAPMMMPWQAMGQYAQGIGGPTVLSSGSGEGKSHSASASGGM